MKKKILSLAVAAGLVGAVSAAQAEMHINPNGLGEALIYPFYSAANGNDTSIHIVNTTDRTKAVKVRFIEAMNSQEVLDFNLYLSPEDVWTGVVTANPNGDGAIIRTTDNSCTVPMLGGEAEDPDFDGSTYTQNGLTVRDQPFVNYKYLSDAVEFQGVERTLEGYIEVIEMGQLDPTVGLGAAAVHGANKKPANCDALVSAWTSQTVGSSTTFGEWLEDEEAQLLAEWEGGGLYGFGIVTNVQEGTATSYDATAIQAFYDDTALHSYPGDELPSLDEANPAVTIFDGVSPVNLIYTTGAQAVSALLMSSNISNDYVVDGSIGAATDWVITMPTKRFFVQSTITPPFSSVWNGEQGTACEPVALEHWDREEAYKAPPTSTNRPPFSPRPPQTGPTPTPDQELCTEVSVLGFQGESALNASERIYYGFTPEYTAGWARMSFLPGDLNDSTGINRTLPAISGPALEGLPVVGFAVFSYQNGDVFGSGVLSNYGSEAVHKSEIQVSGQ